MDDWYIYVALVINALAVWLYIFEENEDTPIERFYYICIFLLFGFILLPIHIISQIFRTKN